MFLVYRVAKTHSSSQPNERKEYKFLESQVSPKEEAICCRYSLMTWGSLLQEPSGAEHLRSQKHKDGNVTWEERVIVCQEERFRESVYRLFPGPNFIELLKGTGHFWYVLKMIVSIKTYLVDNNGELLIE